MATTRHRQIQIPVDHERIAATLVAPSTLVPGVLLVHGWDGSQAQYIARAHEIAALGCICMTIDLRGHAQHAALREAVTPEQNLQDVLAAYDSLVGHPAVDPEAMAIVGSSYGGYLAALATAQRPVRWLALRAPALYRDAHWRVPKFGLDRADLVSYRSSLVAASGNRALAACEAFKGDALIVESEHDSMVPHTVIESYRAAFGHVRSITYRVLSGADHALSSEQSRHDYGQLLVTWMTEMLLGARAATGRVRPMPKNPA